jgi:hypothetical protein
MKLSPIIKDAIRQAVRKALQAKPVACHTKYDESTPYQVFMMDDEAYSEDAAVEHILGEYSWWAEEESK